jgi:hypothetical protein
MSQPARILVARENDRWTVQCAHCDRAWAWELPSEATRSARAHVAALPEGKVSQILVQKDGGPPTPDWICGEDAFPPEG